MNVIEFKLQYKLTWRGRIYCHFKSLSDAKSLVQHSFAIRAGGSQENYVERLQKVWTELHYPQIAAINSAKFLIAGLTISDVQFFLFQSDYSGIQRTSELTVTVVAFSSAEIDHIFNLATKELQSGTCRLLFTLALAEPIGTASVFVYPFDKQKDDIRDPHFRIRAKMQSPLGFSKFEIIKMCFYLVIGGISGALYWASVYKSAKQGPGQPSDWISDLKDIWLLGLGILVTYLIVELLVQRLLPRLLHKGTRTITVVDLTSVVDEASSHKPDSGQSNPPLTAPQV